MRSCSGAITLLVVLLLCTAAEPAAAANGGKVFGWGEGGNLGDGNTETNDCPEPAECRASPFLILNDAVAVSNKGDFTFAVLANGTVRSWGEENPIVLGRNGGGDQPGAIGGLTNVRAVSAGAFHGLALLRNGRVKAWGSNFSGQLGDGTLNSSMAPRDVPLTNIVAVSAGFEHSLALDADGNVWAWGGDQFGQLGDGAPAADCDPNPNIQVICRRTPAKIAGLTNVIAISAGDASFALLENGTVKAWGDDRRGMIGNGDAPVTGCSAEAECQNAPLTIPGLTSVISIAAGQGHALAALADGTARAWGEAGNWLGAATGGESSCIPAFPRPCRKAPVPVLTLTQAASVEAGFRVSFAIRRDGTLWGWGDEIIFGGEEPIIGNGLPIENEPVPVPVGLASVSSVTSGGDDGWRSFALVAPTCRGEPATVMALPFSGGRGKDVILGDSGPNVINGLGGNDVICGGAGDDTIDGGPGLDIVDGGPGSDTALFPGSAGRTINLESGTVSREGPGRRLFSVENAKGSSAGDTIIGNSGVNRLEGLGGPDNLQGGGGGDFLFGGAGDDTMDGGPGSDTLDGGPGIDTASFPGAVGRVINLTAGTVSGEGAGRRLTGVENIKGSNGNDQITGNADPNKLEGLSGADTLKGGLGADVLDGGPGIDTIGGEGGSGDRCTGGAGTDKFLGGTRAASGCEQVFTIP